MMCKLLVLALVAVVPLVSMAEELNYERLENMEKIWIKWKEQHGKKYSPREETYRRTVFFKKLLSIDEHNSKYPRETTFTIGLNQFSDMTFEEYGDYNKLTFTEGRISDPGPPCNKSYSFLRNYEIPESVDWRKKGYVTPVKDQQICAASYAFAATGAIEGQTFRSAGFLVSLSEQQIVDCSIYNSGCEGGVYAEGAFQCVMSMPNGLASDVHYPWANWKKACWPNPLQEEAPVYGCNDIDVGSEWDLQQAVAEIGPIAVAVDANHESFQNYRAGVYTESSCSTTKLNQGLLVVGYGTYQGQQYWLLKNSWGTEWGMGGYMMMAQFKGNMCGVATQATFPFV